MTWKTKSERLLCDQEAQKVAWLIEEW